MLLAPLRYWRVHHPMKRNWDYVFPALGGIAVVSVLLLWPKIPSPYGENGFLAGLQNLYAILGGFFVAALTLVATTETESLKQRMIGSPAVTFGKERHPLERRRFLSLLFGYLAFSSFALYAGGFIATLLAPGLRDITAAWLRPVLSGIFLFGYGAWLTHLTTTTLVGLYYFTDRLNRPDPTIHRRTTTPGT